MTLTQGEFLFHYVSDDGVIALAIAGVEYCQYFYIQTIFTIQTLPMIEARRSDS